MSSYTPPVSRLLTHGASDFNVEWPNYPLLYGLTTEHVPELLRMTSDGDIYAGDDAYSWATIHARRALGQLQAIEAIPGLLAAMDEFGEIDDFWTEELSDIFGTMGPGAVPELAQQLPLPRDDEFTRLACVSGLEKVALTHTETRDDIVAILTAQLAKEDGDAKAWIVNASLVSSLVALKASESAAVIEAAFAANVVDESYCGGWATIRFELGLGPKPKRDEIRPEWWLPLTRPPSKPKRPDPKKLLKKAKSRKRR